MGAGPTGTGSSRFDQLIGKWSLRPYVQSRLDQGDTDFARCQLDDYWLFRADGSYALVDGGTKCSEDEGFGYGDTQNMSSEYRWKLVDNNTKIQFPGEIWEIRKLTDTELVLWQYVPGEYEFGIEVRMTKL